MRERIHTHVFACVVRNMNVYCWMLTSHVIVRRYNLSCKYIHMYVYAIEKYRQSEKKKKVNESEEDVSNRTIQIKKRWDRGAVKSYDCLLKYIFKEHRSHRINTNTIHLKCEQEIEKVWWIYRITICQWSDRFNLNHIWRRKKNCLCLFTRTISFDWWQFQFVYVCVWVNVCARVCLCICVCVCLSYICRYFTISIQFCVDVWKYRTNTEFENEIETTRLYKIGDTQWEITIIKRKHQNWVSFTAIHT